MTIFGMIWLAIVIFAFCLKDIRPLIVMTILGSVFQCNNVITFAGTGIGPQIITSALFVIRVLILRLGRWYPRRAMRTVRIGTIVVLLAVFLSLYANEASVAAQPLSYKLRIVQLCVYIACAWAMSSVSSLVDNQFVFKMILYITVFLLAVGVLQLAITSGLLPHLTLVNELFYNDHGEVTYYYRTGYFRILSTYQEPSYYACFIVGAFYFLLCIQKSFRYKKLLISVILIEILLTFSSTAYGALAIGGVLFVIAAPGIKRKAYLIAIGLVTALLMFSFFTESLNEVIFNKSSSGSAAARNGWNAAALRMFESSPFFGVGYKKSRASSFYLTVLSEQGIIGMTAIVLLITAVCLPLLMRRSIAKIGIINFALRIAVLCAFACMFIAVPDLDIAPLWMWMNCLLLSSYPSEQALRQRDYSPTLTAGARNIGKY
ncbi:O-antigen ligase family protein [Bifidobacterium eulemuris]|uniref:O-antigen ligase family protein n=1 Tax=Bifidobacterium eulemuris TaxID=1765219 RepID=A0A261G564_9BIFI|nr:O-antigen ligase family protein [Bifidobacterium eulemuris]OZG66569.1 O-antigen ligase like membrane protein [Bifidobacterium eulemuris]QOL32652.1 O-antigen ligase family protein [Bifidobacterium eulemuris]